MKELYYIKKEGWEYDELPTYLCLDGTFNRKPQSVLFFAKLEDAIDAISKINDENHLVSIERF